MVRVMLVATDGAVRTAQRHRGAVPAADDRLARGLTLRARLAHVARVAATPVLTQELPQVFLLLWHPGIHRLILPVHEYRGM